MAISLGRYGNKEGFGQCLEGFGWWKGRLELLFLKIPGPLPTFEKPVPLQAYDIISLNLFQRTSLLNGKDHFVTRAVRKQFVTRWQRTNIKVFILSLSWDWELVAQKHSNEFLVGALSSALPRDCLLRPSGPERTAGSFAVLTLSASLKDREGLELGPSLQVRVPVAFNLTAGPRSYSVCCPACLTSLHPRHGLVGAARNSREISVCSLRESVCV